MITLSRSLLQLGTIAGLLTACGQGLPQVTPAVSISSPTDNSTVNLPANKQIALNFNTNYTLKAPGSCAGTDNCGNVYVLVDSSSCNTLNMSYNNIAVSSPTFADLGKCATAKGMHTITLELRHDDESSVKSLIGSPVTSQVTITVQ